MVVVFALCCWLLLKLRGSGEAELLGLLHILFGVNAGVATHSESSFNLDQYLQTRLRRCRASSHRCC